MLLFRMSRITESLGAYSQITLERRENVVKDKQIDKREEVGYS